MTVYIDGIAYEAEPGRNMLEVALCNGLNLPYFCWHPAMGSVGSCRICAVKVYKNEEDATGRIQMACMTPAEEGIRISIQDRDAMEFRRFVIEWLMTNHPHDCPVCDEGGECHLQDMTAMCGQVYRRTRYPKRTYLNQYLGPFIAHEMNRCIQCYRCVRFYRDLAGGRDLNVFASRNRVYFGRHEDGVLESVFSGNLVEVCPTGVFTDKTSQKHYTRKWDLETAPSICPHCSLGCNTIPGARYSSLRRISARFNGKINGYFICDRGRFGYEYVNSPRRLKHAFVGESPVGLEMSISKALDILKSAKAVIGVGSPRASLESNFALQKLTGASNFCNGLSSFESETAAVVLPIMESGILVPSLAEIELCDFALILGTDLTNEAPMADFAVRQAMRKAPLDKIRKLGIPEWDANAVSNLLQNAKGELVIAAPWKTNLDEIASNTFRGSYQEIAAYANSIAEEKDSGKHVFEKMREARFPVIITSFSAGSAVIQAAYKIAFRFNEKNMKCGLFIIAPESNTIGVSLLGGLSLNEAAERIESGSADTLVVLENDITRRFSKSQFDTLIEKQVKIILLDSIETAISDFAEIRIPVAACSESHGTFINNEGRAQRFYKVYFPDHNPDPSWKIIQKLIGSNDWATSEDVMKSLADENSFFKPAESLSELSEWRSNAGQKIPRMPHRYTGRTAKDSHITIVEPRPPKDDGSPFAYTMEGTQNPPPEPLVNRYWSPGWNSENAINKFRIETGQPPHGFCDGSRLFNNAKPLKPADFPNMELAKGAVWIIPKVFVFGSEELSALAPGIAELAPSPEISINSSLAASIGVSSGDSVLFKVNGREYNLPVLVDDSIANNVAVVPFGLPETLGIVNPIQATLRRCE